MAVVKGNAYGHGIEPCVQAMDDLCDWYGTATMQEALRVRSVSGESRFLFLAMYRMRKYAWLRKTTSHSVPFPQRFFPIFPSAVQV